MSLDELILPLPLDHQLALHNSDARFKVVPAGRRWGKSRDCFISAVAGHGPGWEDLQPMFEAMMQGWDVVWIVPTFPQAMALWQEEIKPRFEGIDGVRIVESPYYLVQIEGGGALHIRSAEPRSLRSVRGIGKNLKGCIIDEAAHMDLQHVWRRVVRPILADNEGWAIIVSTTNSGLDGNTKKITPSFFNRLVAEIRQGKRSKKWAVFHGTAADNPKISAEEFAELVDEYKDDDLALQEEIYAKLCPPGSGLAFPEWRVELHEIRMEAPPDALWFGGLDWGYDPDPCAFYAMASFGDDQVLVRHELYVKRTTPYEVGFQIGQILLPLPRLAYIAVGTDTFAVNDGGITPGEYIQDGLKAVLGERAPAVIPAPAGPGSRLARKLILHQYLHWEETTEAGEDGEPIKVVHEWHRPKLVIHPDCENACRTIPELPKAPAASKTGAVLLRRGREDVDTTAEDHPYDAITHGLITRAPEVPQEPDGRPPHGRDQHPGFVQHGDEVRERKPFAPLQEPEGGRTPFRTGVKWRYRNRGDEGEDE